MSFYSNYIKEREDFDIVETSIGFATYKILNQDECYIRDLYVLPAFRQHKAASDMADKIAIIAKSKGCKYLSGTVAPTANNATESIKVLLGYGFKLARSDKDLIVFLKEIQ